MSVPLILWAFTGLIFLTKPGYDGAYVQLKPKLYTIDKAFRIPESGSWHEIKLYRTILGYHFIASNGERSVHLDPFTLSERAAPTENEIVSLVNDAISINKERFGTIIRIEDARVTTDTDVQISLDWQTLTLHQIGRDTRLINTLYKIHYLQWFSSVTGNKILGVFGIIGLLFLTTLGLMVFSIRSRS